MIKRNKFLPRYLPGREQQITEKYENKFFSSLSKIRTLPQKIPQLLKGLRFNVINKKFFKRNFQMFDYLKGRLISLAETNKRIAFRLEIR